MKLSLREKERFFHQLGERLDAGVPPLRALEGIASYGSGRIARVARVLQSAEGSWQEKIQAAGSAFSGEEAGILVATERSGRLGEGAKMLERSVARQIRFRSKLLLHSIYPVVIFHLAVFILSAPPAVLAGDAGVFFRQVLLWLGGFYLMIAVGFFVVLGGGRLLGKSPGLEKFFLALPVIGGWRRTWCTANFASIFGMQLQAGTGVLSALRQTAKYSASPLFQRAATIMVREIQAGVPIAQAGEHCRVFPGELIEALATGDESGKLDHEVLAVASRFLERWEAVIETLGNWLPKLLYFLVALIVAFQIIRIAQGYFSTIQSFMDF